MTVMNRQSGVALIALLLATGATAAFAQEAQERVNVYQYAVDHPQADVSLRSPPSLGASVPQSVELATVEGDQFYGYFYFEGRPVLVDMRTRSVVRIDN